jgi:hypothetical protein
MPTNSQIVWMLGFLVAFQVIVILLAMFAYRVLDERMKSAWPYLVISLSFVLIRRLLGSVRWQGLLNYIFSENVILILITACWMVFFLKVITYKEKK